MQPPFLEQELPTIMMLSANRFRPCARRGWVSLSRRLKSATPTEATTATTTASATEAAASTKTDSTRLMLQSMVAAGAGIVTVSVAAAIVEQSTAASVPVYDAKRQRFDTTTFGGRFASMLLACDPRLLLYTQEQVQQAQALLERHAKGQDETTTDRALWEARRVVTSALHPDTGDVIVSSVQ